MTYSIMVDIETMGLRTSSRMLSLGAVVFSPAGRDDMDSFGVGGRSFYANIDQESYGEHPEFTTDSQTKKWWNRQSDAAKDVLAHDQQPWDAVVHDFNEWVRGYKHDDGVYVWANSPFFDFAIIENHMEAMNLRPAWSYKEKMDFRTVREMAAWYDIPHAYPRNTVQHDSLEDAKAQVVVLQQIFAGFTRKMR